MAYKGHRVLLGLVCTACKSQNFITVKNKLNDPDKLELKKYCKRCRKHTVHKETSKLK